MRTGWLEAFVTGFAGPGLEAAAFLGAAGGKIKTMGWPGLKLALADTVFHCATCEALLDVTREDRALYAHVAAYHGGVLQRAA